MSCQADFPLVGCQRIGNFGLSESLAIAGYLDAPGGKWGESPCLNSLLGYSEGFERTGRFQVRSETVYGRAVSVTVGRNRADFHAHRQRESPRLRSVFCSLVERLVLKFYSVESCHDRNTWNIRVLS